MVDERDVEAYLRRRVRGLGGYCVKLTGEEGIPDRLVLLPGGRAVFVELKRPKGGRVAPMQLMWCARLAKTGFQVEVVRSKAEVDALLSEETQK